MGRSRVGLGLKCGVRAQTLRNSPTAQLHGRRGGHLDEAFRRRRAPRAPGWKPDERTPTEGKCWSGAWRMT